MPLDLTPTLRDCADPTQSSYVTDFLEADPTVLGDSPRCPACEGVLAVAVKEEASELTFQYRWYKTIDP